MSFYNLLDTVHLAWYTQTLMGKKLGKRNPKGTPVKLAVMWSQPEAASDNITLAYHCGDKL